MSEKKWSAESEENSEKGAMPFNGAKSFRKVGCSGEHASKVFPGSICMDPKGCVPFQFHSGTLANMPTKVLFHSLEGQTFI